MLSAEQVASYRENGFVVPDYRLTDATLAALRRDVEALIGDDPERHQFVPTMFDHDPGFIEYVKDPALLDMIEQLAGPDFALWNMSLFGKPARDGKKVPWHQDGEYWPIRPMATTRIWIALDAATRENGCLRYVRGSHRERRIYRHRENPDGSLLLHYEIPDAEIDPADIYDLELEAGQMALHDIYIAHGSEANTTDRVRRAIVINFMPTTSCFDHALAKRQADEMDIDFDHSRRPLFLMRGTDRSGRNDFEIGHDTLGAAHAAE
jgi:hypothetical protein